jgi:N-terminal acetyltransferase 2
VVSSVEKYIPASIKNTWHEWRLSMKKAEHNATGAEEINDHIEMVGWGVEEAEQKHKAGASMFLRASYLSLVYYQTVVIICFLRTDFDAS